jgi:hypothetical protein
MLLARARVDVREGAPPLNDDTLFPWVDAMDGKQMLLTLAQVRSLLRA